MTLADQVWALWKRLKPAWHNYFMKAGLDLKTYNREDFFRRLECKIHVKYALPGLEEFCRLGTRGIEPGDPALSLFYHILASPHVTPYRMRDKSYPTLAELELVENYIYSAAKQSFQSLVAKAGKSPLAVVVFAYEYASAADTVHRCHADLMFSRTGISRVGNAGPYYVPKARGFFPSSNGKQVHVVPARFGAFLAVQQKGDEKSIGPLRFTHSDGNREFWVPLHKLFSGTECLVGADLDLTYKAHHVNQKIRKVHLALWGAGNDSGWPVRKLHQFPFVIKDRQLAKFDPVCGLIVPKPHSPLVEPAKTKEGRWVGFKVPKNPSKLGASLWFLSDRDARRSPEFVHAKHKLVNRGNGEEVVYIPEDRKTNDIAAIVAKGGYTAANFIDWTGDGWLQASCPALEKLFREPTSQSVSIGQSSRRSRSKRHMSLAALSIIAQPDFFPLVKQEDLMHWWEREVPETLKERIWPDQGITASPLSSGRLPGDPAFGEKVFDPKDGTLTTIIGVPRKAGKKRARSASVIRRETTLSYKATNLFAPGWDSAKDASHSAKLDKDIFHLANYGLGSPFPEDTLICAASGGFWPGAVPDVTRLFVPDYYPSTTPILDSEAGWDGYSLPKTEDGVTTFTSAASADYVRAIYKKAFHYERFVNVTFEDFVARTAATARVFEYLGARTPKQRKKYAFLSFRTPVGSEMRMLGKNGWTSAADRTFRVSVAPHDPEKAGSRGTKSPTSVVLGETVDLYAAESAIAYETFIGSGLWHVRKFRARRAGRV